MVSFSVDMATFRRGLYEVERKQVPFAMARALTDTARDIADDWPEIMERGLDRPTPFTKKGSYVRPASKSRLVAEVGLKRRQNEYLRLQLTGGERRPKGRALVVPAGMKLNKYGNMARGAVGKASGRPDTFVVSSGDVRTRHLKPGIYQRPKSRRRKASPASPKMLVSFKARAQYRRRLYLRGPAERVVRRNLPVHFGRRFRAAMATAK